MRVEGLEAAQAKASPRRICADFRGGHFGAAGLAHRQGEVDHAVARALGQVERRGRVGVAGDGEGRAVLHDAGRRGEGEPARGEQVAVEREFGDAPGMRAQRRRARLQQMLDVPVLLLEMLGAEEHALLPDNLVVPHHRFSRPLQPPIPSVGWTYNPSPTADLPLVHRRARTPCRRRCRNRPRTVRSPRWRRA